MLPLHRGDPANGQGGWQEMTIASAEPKRSPKFRLRIRQPKIVLACGAVVFGLWWFLAGFALPSMHPFPPPPPDAFPHLPPPGPGRRPAWSPPPPDPAADGGDWRARAEAVKRAFVHAYHGYEKFAMPADELRPISNRSQNNFNGWGVTMVDSLDTMYIMGLHDEFERGVRMAENMTFTASDHLFAPFFETVIRYLGGLLSAYALSNDVTLLHRADELGAVLLPAFDTPSGFPAYSVNPKTGKSAGGWSGMSNGWLAEIGSCQMEYKYLAKITGKKKYYEVADKITKTLHKADTSKLPYGLLPTLWNLTSGQPANSQISIGAMADSAYEYFLKQYLLTSQTERESLELYRRSMTGILANNLYLSPQRSLLYVTDTSGNLPSRKFEHLSCFLPGLLALGAHSLPPEDLPEGERTHHQWAAKGLALACGAIYKDQPSGLGADEVQMMNAWDIEYAKQKQSRMEEDERIKAEAEAKGEPVPRPGEGARKYRPIEVKLNQTAEDEKSRWLNAVKAWVKDNGRRTEEVPGLLVGREAVPVGDMKRDYTPRNAGYYLRPETIESFYIMWRTTGDIQWRERGWEAFEALEKESRTGSGYAALKDTRQTKGPLDDSMPSYFLAETLKYLYLLFSDEDLIPLDKYVFNTEAHPLPIFEWSKWEMEKFGIA